MAYIFNDSKAGDFQVSIRLDNKKVFFLFVLSFIIVDQLSKIIIWNYFMEVYKYPLIEGLFYFAPIINKDLTYFHALFDLPVNTAMIIAMNAIIILFFLNTYIYSIHKNKLKKTSVMVACMFAISGAICSMLDKIFWGGSLDFLYIERLFICDLKDMYLFSTMLLALVFILMNQSVIKEISVKGFILFCFKRNRSVVDNVSRQDW